MGVRKLAALATSLGVCKAQLIRDGVDLLLRRAARRGNDPLLDLVGQAGLVGRSDEERVTLFYVQQLSLSRTQGKVPMRQNITLSLERELIRKAKILAAQRGTSVSTLLTLYLEKILTEEEAYEAARKHASGLLEHGFHLGGAIPCSRDEWHER